MAINQKLLSTLVLGSSLALTGANAATAQNTDADFVLKATKNQVVITKQFDSIANLQGFVVKPKQGGGAGILYADKQHHYFIAGTLVDASGNNITQQDYSKYVQTEVARNAYAAVHDTNWFLQGKKDAKHTMYVIAEPNCSVCHMLYEELAPFVKSGDLSIRWIMVAFLKPTSEAKAAAIMQAKDPGAAVVADEEGFKASEEEGGVDPVKEVTAATKAALKKNMEFMQRFDFPGTPVVLYKTNSGEAKIVGGLIQPEELKEVINSMSATS